MKDRSTICRIGAGAALAALILSACGGGGTTLVKPGTQLPAGRILSLREARALPKPSFTPTAEATTVPGVVAQPTTRAERTQGPPGNPVALSFSDPPAPGLYPHRVTLDGSFGHQELLFDVDIKAATSIQGGRRQIQLFDIENFPQEFTYVWTPQRLLLEHTKTTDVDGSESECDLKPPALQAQIAMSVGKTWDAEYDCGDVHTKGSSEIIRTERVTIGETQVDTFVIRSASETTSKDGKTKDKTLSWYAPKERLFVIVETKSTGDFGTIEIAFDALSVTPSAG